MSGRLGHGDSCNIESDCATDGAAVVGGCWCCGCGESGARPTFVFEPTNIVTATALKILPMKFD
ncbi:MAG: hypothetical protein H0V17_24490 [Deltaproteobacteria bacterium]|nr:hypothetical protein [Deltaproteobacteria bacterium]